MPDDLRYFTLHDYVGLAPAWIVKDGLEIPNDRAGEPDPLQAVGVTIPYPTMVDGDVVTTSRRVEIKAGEKLDDLLRARIIPGTRTVVTDHPAVADVLLQTGLYAESDSPKSEQPRKPKSTSTSPEA